MLSWVWQLVSGNRVNVEEHDFADAVKLIRLLHDEITFLREIRSKQEVEIEKLKCKVTKLTERVRGVSWRRKAQKHYHYYLQGDEYDEADVVFNSLVREYDEKGGILFPKRIDDHMPED